MEFFAVIPTYNRPDELLNLVTQLDYNGVKGSNILIINNGRGLPPGVEHCTLVAEPRPPHIYRMWNMGLSWAERQSTPPGWQGVAEHIKPHAVAVLNDDLEVPPDFAAKMVACLRSTDATIAFPNQGPGIVNQFPGAGMHGQAQKRITGYCFVVNGLHGIRCDERFQWWYGDDDLDWTARRDFNGTWEVDVTVKHLYPSKSTNENPELIEKASADRELFVQKWGKAPW
jgi:hypothetical protein